MQFVLGVLVGILIVGVCQVIDEMLIARRDR